MILFLDFDGGRHSSGVYLVRREPVLRAEEARVIVATWHRHAGVLKNDWFLFSRHVQIESYVLRHRLMHWLAIDDDAEGWPEAERHHLIYCEDANSGVSDGQTYGKLATAVRSVCSNTNWP